MEVLSAIPEQKSILPRESNKALDAILSLLNKKKVKTIVAGLPLGAQNQRTAQCQDIEKFCRRIARRFPVQIHYVDEYLSSIEAAEQRPAGTKRVDDQAAEIILKRYLVGLGLLPDYL